MPQLQTQYDKLLHPNGSLEVINVQLNDTGNYICEVTIGYRVYKQVNTIEVQGNLIYKVMRNYEKKSKAENCMQLNKIRFSIYSVAPEVITYPSGIMNITLGGIFQITCEPRGVPYPIISWQHNNQKVTNTDDSNRRLTVEVKHYDMAGDVECLADNGVGEPASSGVRLIVYCEMHSFNE